MADQWQDAWSWREQARAWLAGVPETPGSREARAFRVCGIRIVVVESARIAGGQTIDGCLLVRGDLACGPSCRFLGPVYTTGNCEIGRASELPAVACEGRLVLGPSVKVHGSAVSAGTLELRPGGRVGGEAASHRKLVLGFHATASACSAPEIATPENPAGAASPLRSEAGRVITFPAPGEPYSRPLLKLAGVDLSRLYATEAGYWLYDGELLFLRPIVLRGRLRIDGGLYLAEGSLLEKDVEVGGTVYVGGGSVIRANLHAAGDLTLGPGAVFQGELHSEQMVHLGARVRGLRPAGPVQVYARGELTLEDGVLVRGRLESGYRVFAAAGGAAAAGRGWAAGERRGR